MTDHQFEISGLTNTHQPQAPAASYRVGFMIPEGLHPNTATLVRDFAEAMAKKLRASEIKHGWTANWMRKDWRDELAAELLRHVHKGDPIDVAAYAAFAWFHGWSVTPASSAPKGWLDPATYRKDGVLVRLLIEQPADEDFDNPVNPTTDVAVGETWETIGWNNADNTSGETGWEFAGWDWEQDCWTEGRGKVVGWLPYRVDLSATSGGQVATIIPYTDEEGRPDPAMAGLVMIAIGRDGTRDHVLDRIPEKEAAIICEAINHPAPQPAGTPDNPCLRKLRPGEPFFVLLGRDLHAARATRHWAEQREAERGPSPKVDGARQIADQMDAYRGDGVSSAPHPALIYPDDLTSALMEALGVPNFKAYPIAHALRVAGADIPRKSEAEQAHVLHWFVKLALQHGASWWKVAGDEMQRIALAARQSAGEGSANG